MVELSAQDKQTNDRIAQLEEENQRLAEQVKRLVPTEHDLYVAQR